MNNILLSGMAWATSLRSAIASRLSDERGQDFLEYAILAGAIALVAAGAIWVGGSFIDWNAFKNKINDCVSFNSGVGVCGG